MSDISSRIADVIKKSGLKQADFAKRINLSRGHVSGLATGSQKPSDRTISDICREFGVNEIWLRTGAGEMCRPTTQEERIASLVGNALQDEPESIRRQLLVDLSVLTPEDWAALATIARHVAEGRAERQREQIKATEE